MMVNGLTPSLSTRRLLDFRFRGNAIFSNGFILLCHPQESGDPINALYCIVIERHLIYPFVILCYKRYVQSMRITTLTKVAHVQKQ